MKTLRKLPRALKVWLVLAFLASAFCLLSYAIVQQTLRHIADDPQHQMAQDDAVALAAGKDPTSIIAQLPQIDLSNQLEPFVIIYNASGSPVFGSGMLVNAIPVPPQGVFNYAWQMGGDRVTWEPTPGVRIAAIVVPYTLPSGGTGYVLAGRSLWNIERYESQAARLALETWLLTIVSGALLCWLLFGDKKK